MPIKEEISESSIFQVVICDDIRHELNNKVSLMGVFSADILVSDFPAKAINLAIYVQFQLSKGKHTFTVEITYSGEKRFLIEGEIEAAEGSAAYFASPQLRLAASEEGDIEFKVSLDGAQSERTEKKHISKGDISLLGRVPAP